MTNAIVELNSQLEELLLGKDPIEFAGYVADLMDEIEADGLMSDEQQEGIITFVLYTMAVWKYSTPQDKEKFNQALSLTATLAAANYIG